MLYLATDSFFLLKNKIDTLNKNKQSFKIEWITLSPAAKNLAAESQTTLSASIYMGANLCSGGADEGLFLQWWWICRGTDAPLVGGRECGRFAGWWG